MQAGDVEAEAWVEYQSGELVGMVRCALIKGVQRAESIQDFTEVCNYVEKEFTKFTQPKPGLVRFLDSRVPHYQTVPVDKFPKDMYDKLYDYQKESVRRLVEEMDGRGLLSLDMGKGKSATAAFVASCYSKEDILIVTPKSTLINWKQEFKRWVNVDCNIIKDTKKGPGECSNCIISYDSAKMNEQILDHPWKVVIFDESHHLKNPNTIRTKALLKIAKGARSVLMLSGTPRIKCNSELYTQICPLVKDPKSILGSYHEFTERYCSARYVYSYGGRKVWELGKSRFNSELNALLSRVMIRMVDDTNNNSANLPSKTRTIHEFSLTDEHVLHKLASLEHELSEAEDRNEKNQLILEKCRVTAKAKVPYVFSWCLEWLKENPEEKLVVFAQSVAVILAIQSLFESSGLSCASIKGDTPMTKRQAIIEHLRAPGDLKYRVGVLSYGTCSLGITLCPGCYTAVFLELVFTSITHEQSENKLHRVGATRPVSIHYFVATNSSDNMLLSVIQSKTNTNAQVLDRKRRRLVFDTK